MSKRIPFMLDSIHVYPPASFFFGARIRLGTILGRFSINYFSGLGLRIRVRGVTMHRCIAILGPAIRVSYRDPSIF